MNFQLALQSLTEKKDKKFGQRIYLLFELFSFTLEVLLLLKSNDERLTVEETCQHMITCT